MSEKILIVDDEVKICQILERILSDEGFVVKAVNRGREAIMSLGPFDPGLIIVDQNMPEMDGIEVLTEIKARYPNKTVIIVTAYGSIPLAVDAIKKGAYDYIAKPFDNDELLLIVRRAFEHKRLTEEVSQLKKQLHDKFDFRNIIGVSPQMQGILEKIKRVCDTDATVLIQGESGTGKELIVKAIHHNSHRRDQPLIVINCGAVPINLLESEFFGHEKGAFTDAKERKIGKFEQAQGGSLFLDEIGELPLDAQVKLLRVLEDKIIHRVGGHEAIPVDARIIAATNKNLEEEVKNGRFRLDLLYRLNVFTITVPSLRERNEDIPLLVEYFMDKYNKQLGCKKETISKTALNSLKDYHWPGNVRDLENAVESAMIQAPDEVLRLEDLPLRVRGYPESKSDEDLEKAGLEEQVKKLSARIEKELIVKALERFNNNRTHTAESLKISRKTLFNKMKQYDLF